MSIFCISTFLALAQSTNEAILGRWKSENDESTILIEERNGKIFGKIVSLKTPNDESGKPKTDTKNPDEKLRSKPLIGLTILSNMKPEKKNQWSGGRIYDPKSGHSYSCEMQLDGNALKIRGYMGISLIGRTTIWQKIN